MAKCLTLLAVLVLFAVAPQAPARAQETLPVPVVQALKNAAQSAHAMASASAIGNAGVRAAEAALRCAVIAEIERYPVFAPHIVRQAMTLAPSFAASIVQAALETYPGFAPQIRGAAGGLALPPAPTIVPPAPTVTAPAPAVQPIPPAVHADVSGLYADVSDLYAEAPARPPEPVSDSLWGLSSLGITEFQLGLMFHDVGAFGRSEEEGADIALGARFQLLEGEFWELIASPRPHFGLRVNTAGDTSQMFGGITWTFELGSRVFFGADFGLALHDGALTSSREDQKELGLRVLFREAAEIGYRLNAHDSVSLVLDHISNAKLGDKNEGLENFGVRYSHRL